MKNNKCSGAAAAVAVYVVASLLLASCATSNGATLGTVMSTEAGTKEPENPPSKPPDQPPSTPPENKKGLEVISDPDKAEVWIDGSFKGLSPYTAEDISLGWHKVSLRKTGYYTVDTWVEFKSDYMGYQATLVQITGFLQISVVPQDSIVSLSGRGVAPGLLQLPVGSYTVVVRSFGYTDYEASAIVAAKAITTLTVTLQPASFAITSFSVTKPAVNPDSPGLLGSIECRLSVTGPGAGKLNVRDESDAVVFSRTLPEFATWDQSFTWDLRDAAGRALPDGTYTLAVTARGTNSESDITKETRIKVDRSLKVAPRSVWSGSAGLLYAPVAEVLPAGDFQMAILGAVYADGSLFRAPVQLGARIGMGSSLELDASAGMIPSSVAAPLAASFAARWSISSPHGGFGTGSAVQAKLSVQYNPSPGAGTVLMTDTFANFTGISVELPFQLSLGALNLLLSAGATGSLWYPYRLSSDSIPVQGPVAWLYLRAGAIFEGGSVTAGVSASTRTEPLPGGVSFIAWPAPIQAGAEVHWLIPGTHLLLSGIVAGEYEPTTAYTPEGYYFMGGGGLGFLY